MSPFRAALLFLGLTAAQARARAQANTQWIPLSADLPHLAQSAPKVDYTRDIHPLLQERCGNCHLNGKAKGGLRLDTRDSLLKGGASGPAAVPGQSDQSLMIKLVEGADANRVMPPNGQRLTPKEIATLRAWIDGGLSFQNATPTNTYRPGLALHTIMPIKELFVRDI